MSKYRSILAAATALGAVTTNRIYGYENIRRHTQQQGASKQFGVFDSKINRHTGKPHEHRRQKARILRQMAARCAA